MPIVATAGHVDHGKSTLIEALTGRDPDRWAEEKERGLTIDLGFAYRELEGFDIGFVDVPGHEKFIKNMLAGVGAVDVALFVVAADEGWMPQTEEHLAVLDLLDTKHGVVALTRIDITDADTADVSELEILERAEGTCMADWPIIRVSAITGEGMDALLAALVSQLQRAGAPADDRRPRLWVDRSFHISGAGSVVTGTLVGGSIASGDELVVWPAQANVRIRGLQHHDAAVDSVSPGARAALNIVGADADRGMLLAPADSHVLSSRFLATLQQVRSLDDDLTARGAYHVHIGSGSWPVELRVLDEALCLIRSRDPIPMRIGDRFILRETGRKAVVAGGRVLDPSPPGSGNAMRAAAPTLRGALDTEPDSIADALLAVRETADLADLEAASGGGRPRTSFVSGSTAMTASSAATILDQAIDRVGEFHTTNRLRPGIAKAELASSLGVDAATITLVVAGTDRLVDDGATVRSGDFEPGLAPGEEVAWEAAKAALSASLAVPRASQLGMPPELLHALIRDDQLIRVGDDLVYLPEQIETIRGSLGGLPVEFTVADFRDHIGVTRRQAVPLLEWLDKNGDTRRRGDLRVLRNG